MTNSQSKPCRSPYCECEVGKCTHPGFYDARHEPEQEPDAIGCKCAECGEWQRWTHSGMVCKNGHGGVRGINHRLYTTPPQRKPLTHEQRFDILLHWNRLHAKDCNGPAILIDMVERAHGIKE